MMLLALLTPNIFQQSCNFGTINRNDWISISVLVVMATMMIGSLLYSLSGILPFINREKLRGIVRYEAVEGIVSILIIILLITFSTFSCTVVSSLTYSSTKTYDPIQFSENYISSLLFVQGQKLTTTLFADTINVLLAGTATDILTQDFLIQNLEAMSSRGSKLSFSANLPNLFYSYADIYVGSMMSLVTATFGMLLLIYILLPLIASAALAVLIPISIILRSLSFTGPRLRESANILLAISIGLYFVFPLTIVLNSAIINWMYCQNTTICNPYYSTYIKTDTLTSLPTSFLFSTNGGWQTTGYSNSISFFANIFGASSPLSILSLFTMPIAMQQASFSVAEYLFQGIVLLGLDFAITLGFVQGLAGGLSSVSRIMGIGPFWG